MKIAHISDLHYSAENLVEVDRCVDFAFKAAVGDGCECAVLSGDLFDHRIELHQPAVSALIRRVRYLADWMPVLILQGTFSHDTPGSLDVFKSLGGRFPVHVADSVEQAILCKLDNKIYFEGSKSWCFPDTFIDTTYVVKPLALFSCLPPVNKGALKAAAGTGDAAAAAGDYVFELMRGWSVINGQARDAGIPTVVVSHGTVNGCTTEQGVPMHGNDHEFSTGSLFASGASAIMLGHIHQYQEWQDTSGAFNRVIAYPGSPGRLHFGELTDKGFLIWDVDSCGSSCEFIKTPAKELIQINFTDAPDMVALAEQAAAAGKDAHVRIRWEVDEEHKDSVDKAAIAALFDGAAEVKLEGRIRPIQRQRAAGISQAESLPLKISAWARSTNVPFEQFEKIEKRLGMLQHQEPEQILETLIDQEPAA